MTLLALSATAWWVLGFVVAGLVVAVAAGLLLTIIVLARRIVVQAREIEAALVGAREHTDALFDLAGVNHTIESLTRGVKRVRGEQGPADERTLLHRLAGHMPWVGG